MAEDDSERRVLTRKELAKEQRRAAYQRAKEQRASDPRHLAMKEAAKEQRRAAYQKVKQSRKAEATAKKAGEKETLVAQRDAQRTATESRQQRLAQTRSAPEPSRGVDKPAIATPKNAREVLAELAEGNPKLQQYVTWAKGSSEVN